MSSRRNLDSASRHDGTRFYTAPPKPRPRQQMQVPKESAEEAEIKSGGSNSDSIPSVSSPSVSKLTNLDRLMGSISPLVPSRDSSEVTSSGSESIEAADSHPFFCLEDLWESLRECSMYGAAIPLDMNGKDIVQYYVPYLSGIQLYKDASPQQPSMDYFASSSSQSPFFQYLEHEKPHNREPLTDKIFDLASRFPELSNCRSCDLLETSWLCVAWYPICRIPVGPSIEASFLSFYSLSTQSTGKLPPYFSAANARAVYNPADKKFSLPVFGLLSYKRRDSILNPCGLHELEQENSLVQAVDNWVGYLQVPLPDYEFFRPRHYSYRR